MIRSYEKPLARVEMSSAVKNPSLGEMMKSSLLFSTLYSISETFVSAMSSEMMNLRRLSSSGAMAEKLN
jgi:hypothetical protein